MSSDTLTRALVAALKRKGLVASEIADAEAGRYATGLVANGTLGERDRLQALADILHLTFMDLERDFQIDPELISLIGPERISDLKIVPVSLTKDEVRIAAAHPYDANLEDMLHVLTGRAVHLFLCSESVVRDVLARNGIEKEIVRRASQSLRSREEEQSPHYVHDLAEKGADQVVMLVNQVCRQALRLEASDIHVESSATGLRVRYRVDGVLLPADVEVGSAHGAQLVSRIKIMSGLDIAERQLPQDGRFSLRDEGRESDMRVSVMPTVHGEDVVIRLLDNRATNRQSVSLDQLGLDKEVLAGFRRAISEPYGMILVTGPTGSGKTTTLYSALSDTHTGSEKIITIEDPVEYQLEGIAQIPVNEKRGLTFARGLRSVLRHDPDKIMVGEIRDAETAEIAVQASMTGHLVFSTVHANDIMDVIGRLSHMGIDRYNFLSSLKCIMAQRLMRKVCPDCAAKRDVGDAQLRMFGKAGVPQVQQIATAVGCDRCHGTGYRGRFAIAEFVYFNEPLRQLFLDRASFSAIRQHIQSSGFRSLRRVALEKVVAGVTTLEEADRVTQEDAL